MKRIVTVVATLALFVMLTLSAPTAHAAARTTSAAQASHHAATNAVPTNWCSGGTYWSYEGFGQRDVNYTQRDQFGFPIATYTFTVRFDLFELLSSSTNGYCGEFYGDVHVLVPYPRDNDIYDVDCQSYHNGSYSRALDTHWVDDLTYVTTSAWLTPCTTNTMSANLYDNVIIIGIWLHSLDTYLDNPHYNFSDQAWQFTIT
jgi:hypothetical protein